MNKVKNNYKLCLSSYYMLFLIESLQHTMSSNITDHQLVPSFNKRPSHIANKQTGWKGLVKDIVRPPRMIYSEKDLGSKNFILNQTRFQRQDLQVNHQGKNVQVTLYYPQIKNDWVILYLHGNSSSRFEALGLLKYIPFRFALASFDFIGCGLNQQADSISLGHRESEQVSTVVKQLQKKGYKIIIWGRSMGAATALKFGKAPVIVADSSFSCFKSLCKQVAVKNSPKCIPNCLLSCLFPCFYYKLRQDVKQIGDYDVQALDILESIKKINEETFVIFMSGDADKLIDKSNSEVLYDAFTGEKKHLQIFPGTHNTKRPIDIMRKIMKMLQKYVQQLDQKVKVAKMVEESKMKLGF